MPKRITQTSRKQTACTVCQKVIEYTTKKPLKCNQCKNISKEPKPPRTRWKKESQMIRSMSELLPDFDYIVNGYYSWLLSPKGTALQLDWYCPDLGIAVEFNGAQHYTYTKYFHKTKKQFIYQQECDSMKTSLCKNRGITLIAVPYNVSATPKLMSELLSKQNPELYDLLVKSKKIRGE